MLVFVMWRLRFRKGIDNITPAPSEGRSLAWLLTRPVVTSVIIGAKRAGQLQDNLAAVELKLTEDEIKVLDGVSALPPEDPDWMLPAQGGGRLGALDRPVWDDMRQSGSKGSGWAKYADTDFRRNASLGALDARREPGCP